MHELLLHGSVPESRHEQILNILAGVTGMPPTTVTEHHWLFRPNRTFIRREAMLGGTQNVQDVQKTARKLGTEGTGDLYFLRMVNTSGGEKPDADNAATQTQDFDAMVLDENDATDYKGSGKWELRFYDTPDPGKRPVTSRLIGFIPVLKGDPIDLMRGLDYRFIQAYAITIERFIHHNIIVCLQRFLVPKSPLKTPDISFLGSGSENQVLLDESGAYVLEASVRITNNNNLELMKKAEDELVRLKDLLRGVIDLRPLDRLALDTRAR